MMDDKDRELAIEATASAWRPESARALPVHPAWLDLDEQAREEAFAAAQMARAMEAALDARGWSSTVHTILHRLGHRTEE